MRKFSITSGCKRNTEKLKIAMISFAITENQNRRRISSLFASRYNSISNTIYLRGLVSLRGTAAARRQLCRRCARFWRFWEALNSVKPWTGDIWPEWPGLSGGGWLPADTSRAPNEPSAKFSQSRRRPLLGGLSPGWKRLLAQSISHLKHY